MSIYIVQLYEYVQWNNVYLYDE